MKKEKTQDSTSLRSALEVVQEGLRSMQALQAQTASAHQKFLESQTEASRTLQAMMNSIQRLAENSMGLPAMPAVESVAITPAAAPQAEPAPQSISMPTEPSAPTQQPAVFDAPTEASPTIQTAPEHRPVNRQPETALSPEPAPASAELTSTLLDVVSDLTGYPLEMLGLEMNIEADLGIDSIKRVEILSTLEEKIPHLPPVSPEVMGTLKTLGEIVACLNQNQPPVAPQLSSTTEPVAADSSLADQQQPNSGNNENLEHALLAVVGDLTGYPLEMLGLDMDIEADLGIDSIKRVEILSTLEEKLPQLPSVSPEVMGTLKTLGQIVSYLDKSDRGGRDISAPQTESRSPATMELIPSGETPASPATTNSEFKPSPARYIVTPVETALPESQELALAADRKVYITDDRTGLAQAIADEMGQRGYNTVLVSVDILNFKPELPPACGLILTFNAETADADAELDHAFSLTRYLAPGLMASAAEGGAIFASVSRLDGAFGLERIDAAAPQQGALAGLVKTAALEWQGVCCHAVDVDPQWNDLKAAAGAVVEAVLHTGPVEIGLKKGRRSTLGLVKAVCPEGDLLLDEGDVVVISGGARGVTAAAALELARRVRPILILLGRSDKPDAEPDWLKDLLEEKDIKAAILENVYPDTLVSPMQIESFYRKVMAAREINATMDQLREHTTSVTYIPVDVRDGEALNEVIQSVRNQHGPIAAVIHGAGVLEDKLIVDKTPEQFRAVYDTKVKGLQNLLLAAGEDHLKYLVLFSSVTARMGNKGQADYAMANEVLNKIAQREAGHRIGCRVLSINWGPWEGGMVTDALKREFARQGITLIGPAEGARSLANEMANPDDSQVEVVIGGPLQSDAHTAVMTETAVPVKSAQVARDYSVAFERELDLDSYPILNSHVIGGKAVVPLALIAEWICHGALHENPGLLVHGLDDIRILKGIRFDADKKLVRLMAGKIRSHNDGYAVDVELRNGFQDGKDIIHCRAKAVLSENLTAPPPVNLQALLEDNGYNRSANDIYADILFHGHQLHGIQAVASCSPAGMVARVSAAPAPADWMKTPLRNTWIADPLILDSAFQMASLWCFEQHRTVSLPSYAASYRQYQQRFPEEGCTVVLEVKNATEHKMRGDFTFLDGNESVVARLTGFEAVMDSSLNRAFKPDFQTSN